MNIQGTENKALSINRSIKLELMMNRELLDIYGPQVGERWTDEQFVLSNGVIFTAISTGQSIRGINYRNIRPQFLIADDLYDESDINNPQSTENKSNWFWGTLFPARDKSRRSAIRVQGTTVNEQDIMNILEKDSSVKSKTFKAIKDWDKKEVLWPELNSFDSLMADMKKMGTLIFMREMQNELRDDKTSIIKRSYLHNWEYDPIELHAELARGGGRVLVGVIIGNDPSIGKNTESDDTGTALVYKTAWHDAREGNEWWIDWVDGQKMSLVERIDQLTGIAKKQPAGFQVTSVEVEAISGFDDYASEIIRKTNLPVHRVNHVPDKITNLENKSKYFENGKVHLNKNLDPAVKDKLISQLTTNYPKHDDLRDAVLLTLDDATDLWGWI
jgi:hypothetical protein